MDIYRAIRAPSKFALKYLFFSDGLGQLASANFLVDREGYENILVMFVLSGTLHVEQNGHYILNKNQGIIMRLMDKHKYYTDEIDTCEILWIHFNGGQSDFYLNSIEQNSSLPAIFNEPIVEEKIRGCFTLFEKNQEDREFLVSQTIYSMILSILHSISKETSLLKVGAQDEFVNKVTRYVDDNIYNKITLTAFANAFNFSTFHFCRLFERFFHITPMKYVLFRKIEISKYILTNTHESLSSIASNLNFVDQSHFSKTFKRITKKSPLELRKRKLT